MSKVRDIVDNIEGSSISPVVTNTDIDVNAIAGKIPVRDTDAAINGKNQCTAWAEIDSDGTIIAAFNVSSVVRVATGEYRVYFTDTMDVSTMAFVGGRRYAGAEFNPDRDAVLINDYSLANGVSVTIHHHAGGTNGHRENSRFTLICFGGT